MYKVGRSRTPQGVRGLKRFTYNEKIMTNESHSARSAWIETLCSTEQGAKKAVALRKECVD